MNSASKSVLRLWRKAILPIGLKQSVGGFIILVFCIVLTINSACSLLISVGLNLGSIIDFFSISYFAIIFFASVIRGPILMNLSRFCDN